MVEPRAKIVINRVTSSPQWHDARSLVYVYMAQTELDKRSTPVAEILSLPAVLALELDNLPHTYSEPGAILLAYHHQTAIGCVGLRPVREEVAEIKYLYVIPTMRKLGVGRALMAAVVKLGSGMGYEKLFLEAMDSRVEIIDWYQRSGFGVRSSLEQGSVPLVTMEKYLPQTPLPWEPTETATFTSPNSEKARRKG